MECDSYHFFRTTDHIFIVTLIQSLPNFSLFSVTSLKNGSDSGSDPFSFGQRSVIFIIYVFIFIQIFLYFHYQFPEH